MKAYSVALRAAQFAESLAHHGDDPALRAENLKQSAHFAKAAARIAGKLTGAS